PRRTRTHAPADAEAPGADLASRRGTSRRERARWSCRLHSLAGRRVEEMRLVRPRVERDAVSPLRDVPRLGARDELELLAVDLGDAEAVCVGAEPLDALDSGRHAVGPALERLRAQAEDEVAPPVGACGARERVVDRHLRVAERDRA